MRVLILVILVLIGIGYYLERQKDDSEGDSQPAEQAEVESPPEKKAAL